MHDSTVGISGLPYSSTSLTITSKNLIREIRTAQLFRNQQADAIDFPCVVCLYNDGA